MTQYIKIDVPTIIMKNIYQNHIQQHNADTYILYTDRAKIEQGVASANFSTTKRVSNCTSIVTAKLFRFLETINYSAHVAEETLL